MLRFNGTKSPLISHTVGLPRVVQSTKRSGEEQVEDIRKGCLDFHENNKSGWLIGVMYIHI